MYYKFLDKFFYITNKVIYHVDLFILKSWIIINLYNSESLINKIGNNVLILYRLLVILEMISDLIFIIIIFITYYLFIYFINKILFVLIILLTLYIIFFFFGFKKYIKKIKNYFITYTDDNK